MKARPIRVAIGAKVMYLLLKFNLIPIISCPSNSPLQTMPVSGIEVASDPAYGPVRAKQGTCSPDASFGSSSSFCSVAEIENLRAAGHELFYTIDAGPQVKIICDPKSSKAIKETITEKTDVIEIVHAGIGGSPRVVNEN